MTRWLDDDEQRVWRRLAAVLNFLPAELDAQLHRDAGISHFAYMVLAMLSEAPGRQLRMSDLASLANGSQSRLSHLMVKLEDQGWVRRERVATDARGYLAVLTDAGYDKVVATAPGHVERVRSLIFDTLSADQRAQLGDICAALLGGADPNRTFPRPPR